MVKHISTSNKINDISNRELRYYKRNFKKEFNTNLNKNIMEKKLTHYINYLIDRSNYFENYSWESYNGYNDLIKYTEFLEDYLENGTEIGNNNNNNSNSNSKNKESESESESESKNEISI